MDDANMEQDRSPDMITINKRVTKLGRLVFETNAKVIDKYFNKVIKHCEPRPQAKVVKKVKPRTPWSFSHSIWSSIWEYEHKGDSNVSFIVQYI